MKSRPTWSLEGAVGSVARSVVTILVLTHTHAQENDTVQCLTSFCIGPAGAPKGKFINIGACVFVFRISVFGWLCFVLCVFARMIMYESIDECQPNCNSS